MNINGVFRMFLIPVLISILLAACTTVPPENVENICDIFQEKSGWYRSAKESRSRWGVPISIMMATMHQESRFVATAKPPRKKLWGFIPGRRPSDSYGYSQAKESTWEWYQRNTGNYRATRDSFDDAIDFIGWYHNLSHTRLGLAKDDSFKLYLAYHEGHGGYEKQSYRSKQWLIGVARKVDALSHRFSGQLSKCQERLEPRGWFNW